MFDIVRTPSVDLNVYPWRCRQVAIDVDIHVGRTGQPRRNRQTGRGAGRPGSPALASLKPKVLATAVIISMERIIFVRIMAPFSMGSCFRLFRDFPIFPPVPDSGNRKAGAEIYMIFRQPGYLVETQ